MLILVGTFQVSQIAAALAATGMILGAAYMLWLYRRVCYGPLEKNDLKKMGDLVPREFYYFLPLIFMVMWIGVYPSSFTRAMSVSVDDLISSNYVSAEKSDEIVFSGRKEMADPILAEETQEGLEAIEPLDSIAEELKEETEAEVQQ